MADHYGSFSDLIKHDDPVLFARMVEVLDELLWDADRDPGDEQPECST